LDIIGEIVPHPSKQHKFILTATNDFTKWVEAISLKVENSDNIIEFINQYIITSLVYPMHSFLIIHLIFQEIV